MIVPSQEEVIQLIAKALNIPAEKVTADSSADNLTEWDSFGQLCVMQALWNAHPIYDSSKKMIDHPDIATATSVKKIMELFA